jgi:hypothetical protein
MRFILLESFIEILNNLSYQNAVRVLYQWEQSSVQSKK